MLSQLQPGMEVVDSQGDHVGEIKEVRSDDFLLDRPMARDVFIPFSACDLMDGKVKLHVRANEVEHQGWQTPEMIESQRMQKKR
jgi:hypothetical protein